MIHGIDEEMRGHYLLFDGPLELVENARKANENVPNSFIRKIDIDWPGRKGNSWKDIDGFLRSSWKEAVAMIKRTVAEVMKKDLPTPVDARRKPRWSETEGEVDVDRAMHGDPDYMRLVKRQKVVGPFHVCLVTNMDTSRRARTNRSGLYFRSACCIALADVLEELGYTTEIWAWTRGLKVYPEPYPNQFVACRPKKAGDPVDYDAMADTMSNWFTKYPVFGSFACAPVAPVSAGYEVPGKEDNTEVEKTGIGGWIKYLDIGPDVFAIGVPMIWGSLWGDGLQDGIENAAEGAAKVLQAIVDRQSR